ncbi:MAG: CAF17-like 4Fe-4S cluster assembly/insertion protein YgfZ [Caulobacteraceae bacterium]
MTHSAKSAHLDDRALVRVAGPDWRSFLQGLITQDVETFAPGEVRYGAMLTPQGKLLYDMVLWADEEGVTLDVAADTREAMIKRLSMYRLRAKATIEPQDGGVYALWSTSPMAAPTGWRADPRDAGLGWRALGAQPVSDAEPADLQAYDAHRLSRGVGDLARDGLIDKVYAVEANLDLLNGVDFKKGCFVGQEITSRMKRRGTVKTRLIPIRFDGPAPAAGAEVLTGALRAGEVRSGGVGQALALLRLDRAHGGALTVDGRAISLSAPPWLTPTLSEIVSVGA